MSNQRHLSWVLAACPVCILAVLGISATANALESDTLMQRWAKRARNLDCLYIEGTIEQFRVPATLDVSDSANWQKRPEVCRTVDFTLWLRRPDFRLNVRERPKEGSSYQENTDFSWIAGRLTVLGGIGLEDVGLGGSILAQSKSGRLLVEPFLTPVEYHFFDYPGDDVPHVFPTRPHMVEDRTIWLQPSDEADAAKSFWAGMIQFGSEGSSVPQRMALSIKGPKGIKPVEWECVTLATQKIGDVDAITDARIVLYNPEVLPQERVLYRWTANKMLQRPMSLSELEIKFPKGTSLHDYTKNVTWKAGELDQPKPIDPEVLRVIRESIRAQLSSPESRERQ